MNAVFKLIIRIIIYGLCFYLLWWLLNYCALPAPFDKVGHVVLAVAAVCVLIWELMKFTDKIP